MRGIMLFAMPLSVRLDSSDYGHPLHADVVASKEYGVVFRKYGNVMRAGVTPPVIPWFFQESLADVVAPIGIPGRVETWVNEQTPFRDATAGRGYGTRLLDAEIMQGDEE